MASAVVITRLEDREHIFDEDAIHVAVHIKDLFKHRELINFAPRLGCTIGYDRIFRPALLLFLYSIFLLSCGYGSLLDLP